MSSNETKYIALTIGPIYQTFLKARKLKQFWCVSYLFSHIMKLITKQVYDKNYNILLPAIVDKNIFDQKRVGLFPDWLIFESPNNDANAYEMMNGFIRTAITETAGLLDGNTQNNGEIESFLFDYLKFYYIEVPVQENENPILYLSDKLHQIELHNTIPESEYVSPLYKIFANISVSKFYKEHYLENGANAHHLSMFAIATKEFADNEEYKKIDKNKNEDESLFAELSKINGIDVKSYHKYVAIVKADGDKIGQALKSLDNTKDLSKRLLDWGSNTRKLIDIYGGVPIYISGDDVFFFAPIVGNNSKNILTLIATISCSFEKEFKDYAESKPTVSFGLSISYYKYPLYEAMISCDNLLNTAKNNGGNCVEICVLKHSGQVFTMNCIPSKTNSIFEKIQCMLNSNSSDESQSLISSVSQHLRANEDVFRIIGYDEQRIEAFFENCIESHTNTFTKKIQEIIILLFKTENKKSTDIETIYEKVMNEVYSIIRIVKFLKGLDENDK